MKIVITGSHFTPAQAVIESLNTLWPNVEIIYIGRRRTLEGDKILSIESQILPKLNIKFIPIIAGRLQRVLTFYTIPALFKIPLGFIQSFFILSREKPDIVLSFGGYVAVPVVVSAWLLSIPVIIHEQTLITGLANTITSYFAKKIAISFDREYPFQKDKIILTGNPIRKDVIKPSGFIDTEIKDAVLIASKEKLPLIFITGGNQGSHVINDALSKIIDSLTQKAYLIHQTGDSHFRDFEKLTNLRSSLKYPKRYVVRKWVQGQDLGMILQSADLAISRAGINTLLELAYYSIPSIVIPIPYLYKDEQMVNATYFKSLGLVEILTQDQLTGQLLKNKVDYMLKKRRIYKNNARLTQSTIVRFADAKSTNVRFANARSSVYINAAERLAQETLILAQSFK